MCRYVQVQSSITSSDGHTNRVIHTREIYIDVYTTQRHTQIDVHKNKVDI